MIFVLSCGDTPKKSINKIQIIYFEQTKHVVSELKQKVIKNNNELSHKTLALVSFIDSVEVDILKRLKIKNSYPDLSKEEAQKLLSLNLDLERLLMGSEYKFRTEKIKENIINYKGSLIEAYKPINDDFFVSLELDKAYTIEGVFLPWKYQFNKTLVIDILNKLLELKRRIITLSLQIESLEKMGLLSYQE